MTNRLAVASLVLAVLAVVGFVPFYLFVPLLSVPAAILGVIARRNAAAGRGIALAGTIIGVVVTAAWAVAVVAFLIRYWH